MHRMLVDEKITIEGLNEFSRIIDIGKIFFSLMLEKCNSVDMQPKKNVLLKIIDFQMKLITIPNYDFSKNYGARHNDMRNYLLS